MRQFGVGTQALRDDVRVWDQQSSQMKQIVDNVGNLRMDRLEAGVFQIFVSAYQEAVSQVADRASEGSTALSAVATTLARVAGMYEQAESVNTHKFKDLH